MLSLVVSRCKPIFATAFFYFQTLAEFSNGSGEVAYSEVGLLYTIFENFEVLLIEAAVAKHFKDSAWEVGYVLVSGVEMAVRMELL